jgi:hypothetical protein
MASSNASSTLLEWATLERQASHEEAHELLSLLNGKILLSLPLPHSCYLPTKIQGTHFRSLFYRAVGIKHSWAQFWMFSDKAYGAVREAYPDTEESGGKRKRLHGSTTVMSFEKQACNI